jgi:heme-degrading monooxygenase HmoA
VIQYQGEKMFARITTVEGKPEKVNEGARNYREKVLPAIKKLHGFKHAYLLVDRKTGVNVSVVLWDTEKDVQASITANQQLRSQFAEAVGADKPPTVGNYEVAEQA